MGEKEKDGSGLQVGRRKKGSRCDREGKDAECDIVGKISRRGDEKERFTVGWRRIDFTEC